MIHVVQRFCEEMIRKYQLKKAKEDGFDYDEFVAAHAKLGHKVEFRSYSKGVIGFSILMQKPIEHIVIQLDAK